MKLSEALRHSNLKFKVIAESAVDCIFLKNNQRRYTYVNKAMQNLLGLPEADIRFPCRMSGEMFWKSAASFVM